MNTVFSSIDPSANNANLRGLTSFRAAIMALLLAAALVSHYGLGVALPLASLLITLAMYAALTALTWWSLRKGQQATESRLFLNLILDVIALTILLAFSGGSANPLAFLLLLPVALAAAALSASYVWGVVALAVLSYSGLMLTDGVMRPRHGDFTLHLLGMWFGFIIGACVIGYFAVRMSTTLRARERALAAAREQSLRDERLLALGTLAAGAAHELGTPLTTMAILVDEIAVQPPQHHLMMCRDLDLLRDQISRCKTILASLAMHTQISRAEAGAPLPVDIYLDGLLKMWQRARPEVMLDVHCREASPIPVIVIDQTFSQALLNILNNAADASPTVRVTAHWDADTLIVAIMDAGGGFTTETLQHAGEPFFTTKAPGQGMGLGLYLARATIVRLGGKLTLSNRTHGGAMVHLELPLSGLSVER